MAQNADWYPTSMDALLAWWVNFFDQLRNHGFASKYGVSSGDISKVEVMKDWFVYWVPFRHSEDVFSQQTTAYFNTIAGSKPDADPPSQPIFAPIGSVPTDPEPGIESYVRSLARSIKNSTIYAPADGEAMGIVTPGVSSISPGDMQPTFKATTREAFEVGVTFKKLGMSAVRFEYRHKGGGWLPAGVIINSPGSFAIAPAVPGEPEQIELRAIFMQGNNNVGIWSTIVVVYIGP